MTNKQAINILLNEKKCIDRNDGVQCNRECGSCDLVMDVETIREAYSMAISALEERDLPSTNVGDTTHKNVIYSPVQMAMDYAVNATDFSASSDTISRQSAIDEIARWKGYLDEDMIERIQIGLKKLPSAQPEIIRCKDCKWKQGAECVRFADVRPFPDDYCSRAERREDGQNA